MEYNEELHNEVSKFFFDLGEDQNKTMELVQDRIEPEVILATAEYISKFVRAGQEIGINPESLVICAALTGYLLKGHIDRKHIEKSLNI